MTQRAIFLGGHFHGHTRDVRGSEERLELPLPEPPRQEWNNQSMHGWTPTRRVVVVYVRAVSDQIPDGVAVFVAEGYEPGEEDQRLVIELVHTLVAVIDSPPARYASHQSRSWVFR